MEGKEVLAILKSIERYYPTRFRIIQNNRVVTEEDKMRIRKEMEDVVRDWHKFLKDYEFENVMETLDKHVLTHPFPPAVSDLLPKQPEQAIPSLEETKALLDQYEQVQPANDDVAKKHLAQMRKILGIRRERP